MAEPNLHCIVCGIHLPKYMLDRYSEEYCGPYCDGRDSGKREGMKLLQALQDWALAIKERCREWHPGSLQVFQHLRARAGDPVYLPPVPGTMLPMKRNGE